MSDKKGKETSLKIGLKPFLLSVGIILALMIVSGVLTRVLPAGEFSREIINGRTIVINDSYQVVPSPHYPIWRWFTAPIEVLYFPDNLTLIMLIVFILVVGGSICILEYAGVMQALIDFLLFRFSQKKYLLISVLIFFFMAVASFVGIYEEMVPLIVFVIPIAISLGWDSLTGLGMSLLPLAFGFSAAVFNPFTIGVAQKIAELPLFSGAWFRIIFFVVVYFIVNFFVIRYAKKVERNPQSSICFNEDEKLRQKLNVSAIKTSLNSNLNEVNSEKKTISRGQKRALIWFASSIAFAMLFVLSTSRIEALSNVGFPLMTLLFLIGGVGAGLFAEFKIEAILKTFWKGMLNIMPGIILVLMAYSVKHIITTGMIMDTILFQASELIKRSPPMTAAFLVYATTLVMNFFIGSASAKAFLMMPILTPLADLVGITRQTTVLAFDFGDGFSNMFYPTNALLLIALSLSVVGYTKWVRWTWKLQITILLVTSIFLAIAVRIGFGP